MGFFDRFKSQPGAEDMSSAKQPADMTPKEVAAEVKRMTSQKYLTAGLIGLLLGIAVWSATHGGLILPGILVFFAFLIGYRSSQRLKSLQAEMSRKGTVE